MECMHDIHILCCDMCPINVNVGVVSVIYGIYVWYTYTMLWYVSNQC